MTKTHTPGTGSATGSLLRLLREEADEAEFHAVGADGPLVGEALEIRSRLAAHRRREAALAALCETAADLASLPDLQDVLQAIVRRARALVGTDAAYLLLHDRERGDTYVRVTDGITTEAFRTGRFAAGTGLGGLVAETAQPCRTTDHPNDDRFAHSGHGYRADSVVGAEGLVAIQGVPLKAGDQVYGGLFAADRAPRPFSTDEVELLVPLADFAALAIENATLVEQVRKASAVHERLTAVALDGGGPAELAHALADVLRGSVLVLDSNDRPLAWAGDAPPVPAELVRELSEARRRRVSVARGGSCVTPIVAAGENFGTLFFVRGGLDASDVHALERAAQAVALMLLGERTVAEAEQRLRGEILDDLLGAPDRDPEGLRRRAALVGLDLERAHTVLVARGDDGDRRRRITELAGVHAARTGGIAGEYGGNTVVVLPGPAERAGAGGPGAVARVLAEMLTAGAGGAVTVGGEAAGPGAAAVVEAHRDAARCLDVLFALGRAGDGACRDELGIHGLLLGRADREELDRFVRRTIGPLVEHDAARGSELARTALEYFARDGNLARTAAALYVHVNTLYQRIDRISALLGKQWRHGDQALQVHLALKTYMTSH
ncbi:helix-turn-helix domain-containing protein [Streptomyces sp. NPDC020681]|uniref:helix-turn-helix domain-containing protein n=1 Tax=Streptomyces sp. NPDC020681 TaxID=3365083 RepID=UPI00379146D7